MGWELKQQKHSLVNVVGEAAVLHAKLWQYLREQADAGQLKAIEDDRAADVSWHHLTEALCVTSKQGVYQKARRLKAEQVRDPGERRTPEIACEHEDCVAAEQRAERALMLVQERRSPSPGRSADCSWSTAMASSWTAERRTGSARAPRPTRLSMHGSPGGGRTSSELSTETPGSVVNPPPLPRRPPGPGTGHRVHLPESAQDPQAGPAFPL